MCSVENLVNISSIVQNIDNTLNCYREILCLKNGFYIGDVYVWDDGSWYYGDEKNRYAHGYGIFYDVVSKNIYSKYVGQFKNGKFHGFGTVKNCDGEYYSGYWENGYRHGMGKTYFLNGNIEVGKYMYNSPDGWFKIIYSKSKKNVAGYTCLFNMGNIMEYGELL